MVSRKNEFSDRLATVSILESLQRRDEDFCRDKSQCVERLVRLKFQSNVENCEASKYCPQREKERVLSSGKGEEVSMIN